MESLFKFFDQTFIFTFWLPGIIVDLELLLGEKFGTFEQQI